MIHVPAGTYQLASAPITLSNGTLQGAGAGSTIIKAAPNNRVLTFGTGTVATISGVTITGGNLPAGQGGGGGVFVPTAVAVTIVNSAVVGNVAPEGGGIFTQGRALTLVGTTVSGNTATAGGGISVDAGFPAGTVIAATLTNSTVSGNVATNGRVSQGAGINTDGALTLQNTTVAGNQLIGTPASLEGAGSQGAGVGSGTPPTATIRNSIIAGNTGAAACQGDPATIASVGRPQHRRRQGCGFSSLGDKPGVNPLFGPLAANGGPTATRAERLESCRQRGSGCTTAADQRGRARGRMRHRRLRVHPPAAHGRHPGRQQRRRDADADRLQRARAQRGGRRRQPGARHR